LIAGKDTRKGQKDATHLRQPLPMDRPGGGMAPSNSFSSRTEEKHGGGGETEKRCVGGEKRKNGTKKIKWGKK